MGIWNWLRTQYIRVRNHFAPGTIETMAKTDSHDAVFILSTPTLAQYLSPLSIVNIIQKHHQITDFKKNIVDCLALSDISIQTLAEQDANAADCLWGLNLIPADLKLPLVIRHHTAPGFVKRAVNHCIMHHQCNPKLTLALQAGEIKLTAIAKNNAEAALSLLKRPALYAYLSEGLEEIFKCHSKNVNITSLYTLFKISPTELFKQAQQNKGTAKAIFNYGFLFQKFSQQEILTLVIKHSVDQEFVSSLSELLSAHKINLSQLVVDKNRTRDQNLDYAKQIFAKTTLQKIIGEEGLVSIIQNLKTLANWTLSELNQHQEFQAIIRKRFFIEYINESLKVNSREEGLREAYNIFFNAGYVEEKYYQGKENIVPQSIQKLEKVANKDDFKAKFKSLNLSCHPDKVKLLDIPAEEQNRRTEFFKMLKPAFDLLEPILQAKTNLTNVTQNAQRKTPPPSPTKAIRCH